MEMYAARSIEMRRSRLDSPCRGCDAVRTTKGSGEGLVRGVTSSQSYLEHAQVLREERVRRPLEEYPTPEPPWSLTRDGADDSIQLRAGEV